MIHRCVSPRGEKKKKNNYQTGVVCYWNIPTYTDKVCYFFYYYLRFSSAVIVLLRTQRLMWWRPRVRPHRTRTDRQALTAGLKPPGILSQIRSVGRKKWKKGPRFKCDSLRLQLSNLLTRVKFAPPGFVQSAQIIRIASQVCAVNLTFNWPAG